MARQATQSDFEGGAMYDVYPGREFFVPRATILMAHYAIPSSWRVLVVGCGYGYLVSILNDLGVNAWGIDVSSYCITKAQQVLPFGHASKVLQCDMTNRSQLNSVRQTILGGQNRTFELMVSDDVLPVCNTESEAALALSEARRSTQRLCHFITCTKPEQQDDLNRRLPGLLWRSRAQWRAILNVAATTEPAWDCEGYVLF